MITVCAPTKAAMLAAPPVAAVTAAVVMPDALTVLLVVMVVLAVALSAVFIHLMRQPTWKPSKPLRRHAIPSYRAAAESPARAISERRVIDGTGFVVRDETRERR